VNPDRFEELDILLIEWEDGTLDRQRHDRLLEILRSDEAARAHYLRTQTIQAALKLGGDAGFFALPHESAAVRRAPETPLFRHRRLIAVASLLVCVLTGRLFQLEFQPDQIPSETLTSQNSSARNASQEARSQGVAVITRLVDVVWNRDQKKLHAGDALKTGRLAIEAGYIQLEFFCGATVILEGPAELEVQSAMLARVKSGRLRVQVPPAARGFALQVADMTVVDLGTEFGLSVSAHGANVQVFDGEVELRQPESGVRLLTAGQGLLRTNEGSFQETEVTPVDFLDIGGLETRAQNQQTTRYQRWKDWSRTLLRDPRLVVWYSFEQNSFRNRTLSSRVDPQNRKHDGAIVGARRVPGRWPEKSGLEFKRPGDRVRVNIPGKYASLSFACWVRIDSLDRWFNSLFLTDNYNQGEPHWQILDTGQLYFSVRPTERGTAGPGDYKALSPAFWKPSMSGRWLHLATVYSLETGTITHYLDGQILSQDSVPERQIVATTRIGTATIGNWDVPTRPDSSFAVRNLNGSIDEFLLFSGALQAHEISEMYDNGKP